MFPGSRRKWPLFRRSIGLAMIVSGSAFAALTQGAYADEPGDDPSLPNSLSGLLFDQDASWKEAPLTGLPALPLAKNLLPFSLSPNSPLTTALDTQSLSIGKDGVVRYTVVIESSEGARNVRYEGIHCASYRWRLYSGSNSDATQWDNASTPWRNIGDDSPNNYHALLAQDYFCSNKVPVAKTSIIVNDIKYGHTVRDGYYR